MLTSIPVVWQYVLLGIGALLATVLVLWAYNRREKRRKHALQLAKLMNRWGLEWFAEAYEMYAVGDYSGLTWKVKEIVEAVRSDEAMVSKLWEVTLGVLATMGIFDVAKASEEIASGAEVYWDRDGTPVGGTAGSGAATTTATGNTYMGTAIRGAQVIDTTVRIGLLSLAGSGAGSSPAGPTGATGPAGATGAVGLTWRGAWNSGVAYQGNEAVRWNGSSYICLQANTGRDPQSSPTYWDLLAARGDTGSVGPQGAIGPVGPQGTNGAHGAAGR